MPLNDAFGSGQEQLRQSLLEQYQPDDGQPFSVEPKVLTDRLARKLAIKPTRDADVDFNVAPTGPQEKEPDLSKFGKPVAAAPAESDDDLSAFGTEVKAPEPAKPGLTVSRQAAALAKGIPHGAISSTGGILKGAGALYDNGVPAQGETPQTDAMGNVTGAVNPPTEAVPAKPLQDRTLYKAGQATQDFAQTVAPMSPEEKDSIGGRIGTGAGSIAAYGAATLAAGPLVGLSAAAGGMALDTYGSVFEAAKAAGKTDDEANSSASKSALVAGVLGSLPLGAGKYAQSLIAKVAVSAAAFTTLGEAQEAILQQIAKEYDPKAGYTLDQKRLVAELVLGAGMGGLHHAFRDRDQPPPQQQPGQQPGGAQPQQPGAGLPPPGAQPGAGPGHGPQPGANSPPPGGGPQPNAGGPGQQQAPPGAGAGPTPGSGPGKPPPGTGTGKAGEAGYTMDAQTRAKMEKVYRHFERGKDPSGLTDGELFDAVNEHLRDTSSTGHTAKPETPEEAAAREGAAKDREQRDILKQAGWTEAHINAMTPEQREQYVARAQGKAKPEPEPDRNEPRNDDRNDDATAGRRDAPIKAETADDILNAQPVEPKSAEQAQAENYQHAHVEIDHLGLTGKNSISIETGVGQERRGIGHDGKEWAIHMPVAYGRIKGTKGADGQPLDVFVGPQPKSRHVFVVDQHDPATGDFDEHKIMVGFPGPDAAIRAYADSHDDQGEKRIGHVVAMTPDEFQGWLKTDTTKPLNPAAGSKGHHTPEPALESSESHHTPEPPGAKTDEVVSGGSPSPPVPNPTRTEGVGFDSVNPENGASPSSGEHKGVVPAATKSRKSPGEQPQNLLQFIASKGGLKPHPELEVMDAHKHTVAMGGFPPRRKLVKAEGMDLDRAREAAEEAGYFRAGPDSTSTVAEFLDAIDDGIRGTHRYPEGYEGHQTKQETTARDERVQHELERAQDLVDQLEAAGHGELGPEIKDRVLRLMATDGVEPDQAVDIALAQLDREEQALTGDEIDATFGPGASDAIQQAVPFEGGEPDRPESQQGDRSQEGAPDRPRPGASDQGEATGAHGRDDAGRTEPADNEPDTGSETGREAARRGAEDSAEADNAGLKHSRAIERALDNIEEAVEAGDRDAVLAAGRAARKVLADVPASEKAADPDYWKQFDSTIRKMVKPGYVTGKQEHDATNGGFAVGDAVIAKAVGGHKFEATIKRFVKNYPDNEPAAEIETVSQHPDKKGKLKEYRGLSIHKLTSLLPSNPTTRQAMESINREQAAQPKNLNTDTKLWELADTADKTLDGEAARAIDGWVGGGPGAAKAGAKFGVWHWDRLETALSGKPDGQVKKDIAGAFAPVRDYLRKVYGDTLTLHRYERSDTQPEGRTIYSYTADQEGMAHYANAPKEKKLFTEDDIAKAEQTFEKTGRVDVGPGRMYLERQDSVLPGQTYVAIMDPAVGGEVTDTPSVRAYMEDENKHRREVNDDRAAKLSRAKTEQIPLDQIVWVTDRFNQQEFVVRKPPIVTTEIGADNKPQMVMRGTERASDGTMAKRAAAAPLKPKVAQRAADDGLFGDGHNQTDLLDMAAKAPAPAKDAFDDIFDSAIDAEFAPKMSLDIDDVAKGLGKLFGKGLKESEPPFVDEEKYKQALPFFKAGVEHFGGGGADLATMVRSLVRHLSVAGMDADAIRAMKPYIRRFTDDVTAGRETINAPSRSDVLESDRGEPASGDGVGKADVPAAAGADGQGPRQRGIEVDAGDERSGGGERVSQSHAPAVGAHGNLELPAREPDAADRDATAGDDQRSADGSQEGFSFDDGTTDEAIRNAQRDADLNARRERQRKAEGIKVVPGDIANIADTLPMLFPEQHEDVLKAEQRFAKPDGHGMLFTNGTGTGKTYSGLGVIKRFAMQGKTNAMVVAPSQGILLDWVRSAKDLGLDMRILDSTVDNGGKGLVGTTYANLGANKTLADRTWDLVVLDEAHKLSSDQDGTATAALSALRAITLHPDGLMDRARMVLRTDWDRIDREPEARRPGLYAEFQKKADPLIAKWKEQARPKALMMSATPFAYHFSLDYANGYLFDYGNGNRQANGGYNSGSDRDRFYMQHLGYRMRTNKLTKPDADVKSEVMERQLHEYLKKQGSLSGRALTVDKDYDRKFVLAHDAVGSQIDQALNFLQEAEGGRYRPLHEVISKQFDYLTRMRLLEAIKAKAAGPFIKESLALGRKVVVFHDYNEGGGINPFDLIVPPSVEVPTYIDGKASMVKLKDLYDDFRANNPYIADLKFSAYLPPIAELTKTFPDALVYNGTVPTKQRDKAKALFNDDNSGRDLIIIQSAAGEAGISLHDTTGKKQRVLLNLGMPVRPTTSIQQEGRIYRVGQASDAMFRYMNTGTDWERWTFAGKIAERAGTAENLALGDLARTIRQSFIDAFSNAGDYRPEPGEGTGGKELDRATTQSISEFDKARTHYFANAKTTGRRDQREGVDYYATPEPVGLKMVEFAGLRPGEKILEPSAGHGAIARYFPEDSARTLVEPSSSLASRAALTSPGARVVVDQFENLDVGANKFDAIVMNPPFGSGGKTAVDHLEKAAKHLKNGGRIVALIPRGGSADGRLEKFTQGAAAKNLYLVGDIDLPSVTFERAGTGARTHIVVFEKQTDPEIAGKLEYQRNRDYSDIEKIGDLFDRIEHLDMGRRLEPKTPDIDIPTEGKVTVGGVDFTLESSKRGDLHAANLKSFAGIERFRQLVRAAEASKGEYVKTARSFRFNTEADRSKFLDMVANPPEEVAPQQPKAPSGVTFKTGETVHAKTGDKLFVATANERVASDVYSQMNAVAKANGGWYSSFRGRGAIPGFQFKSAEARQAFLDQMGGGKPDGGGPGSGLGEPASDRPGETGQRHVLDRGREIKRENYVAYGADGAELSRADGIKDYVGFTPEFLEQIKNPANDIVAHHNHPSSGSISQADLMALAYPGLTAVWAHGHDGSVYRAEFTPEYNARHPHYLVQAAKIKALYDSIRWRLHTPMQEAIYQRLIGSDEANGGIHHLTNEVLAQAGVIDYRSNYQLGDLVDRVPGLDSTIRNAIEAARKEAFGDNQATSDRVHRRTGPLRHAGDVGATFDRSALVAGIGDEGRRGGNGEENDFNEEPTDGLGAPPNPFQPGGPNSFDNTIADILRTRLLGRLGDINATEIRVQLQDKFLRVKKAEESVGAPSNLSAYQAESLYYGRTGQRLEQLTEHHIDPLIREMKARDIDLEKLDQFLYARHAPERNNKLGQGYLPGDQFYDAMNNPDIVGASGMSTNEALDIIRAIRAEGKLGDYLAVARMIDALNAKTRRTLFDGGLIDRDTFDALNAGYKYYVPLRGHTEGSEWMATGSGMNVRGKEFRQAFGRRSKASSPLAYSIMQAEMAVIRAEKNKVGNTFLQFVRANPDPARWTVDRPPLVKKVDPTTGLVTAVPDNLYANRDNVFTTKVQGRDIHIALHGPDGLNLARALKNMGTANVHALIRAYSAVTHAMAKLATSWNPEFMIPNFARDIGEAFINLQAQEQKRFVRNFVSHIPGAMKGSMDAIAGRTPAPGSNAARYVDAFHRFDEAGGRVRFFGIDDPDQIESNVNRRLKRLEGGPLNTLKDIGDKAGKALEIAGGGIENATRLAAFMAAEDAGMSTADAAMLARNLTVDFNKKGELGGAISSLYMFANAGIQGQARMVRAMGYRRVWQAVGGLAAAAALSALYSILAGNTDSSGVPDYMKIPTWERDKNLIFMTGSSGHYIKLPLPYGFSPFAVVGAHAVSVIMGHEKPGKAASAVMDSIVSAFNPLGEESTAWMDIVPSAIRPAFHIEFNKNWTGKPLYPDQDRNRGNRPDSTQAFRTNSAFSKEAAKLLNEWSGGSAYKPGLVDIHPGSIDHVLQAIGGGVGRFVKGVADSMYNNLSGGEWQPEKIPLLRRFVGKVGPEADNALYYEKRQEVLDEKAGVNAARRDLKNGTNTDDAKQFLGEAKETKASIFKSADDRIRTLRQQKNLTDTELKEKIREVQNDARKRTQALQPSP